MEIFSESNANASTIHNNRPLNSLSMIFLCKYKNIARIWLLIWKWIIRFWIISEVFDNFIGMAAWIINHPQDGITVTSFHMNLMLLFFCHNTYQNIVPNLRKSSRIKAKKKNVCVAAPAMLPRLSHLFTQTRCISNHTIYALSSGMHLVNLNA